MSQVQGRFPPIVRHPTGARQRTQGRLFDFVFAGLAPSISIMIFSPLDVVKSRIQSSGAETKSKSQSAMRTISNIIRQEGVSGVYRGLGISIMREASLNVLRLGLYDPLMSVAHEGYRDMASASETGLPPLYKRIAVGSLCGVIGSMASNPMELVKCRLQCAGESATSSHMYQYKGVGDAMRSIVRTEGFGGLWNGAKVFAIRNAVGSAANLSTFSALKAYLVRRFDEDSIKVDVAAGVGSGFVTTCVMCPLDMMKTRIQNQPVCPVTREGQMYRNAADAFWKIGRLEGVSSFYRGFSSLFIRTGPHYVATFTIYGILKRWVNDPAEY